MDLRGATVLITGASSGIGAATARAMAARGATVLLLARSASRLKAVGESLDVGGEGRGSLGGIYAADLSEQAAVDASVEDILAAHGTPDVLVNNAGVGRMMPIEETDPAEAEAMVAVPYLGALRLTRAFSPRMIDRGSGHVVNVTSAAAYVPWPGSTAYAASRWAMRGFSEALSADLGETGVGVSLVAATTVESTYWAHNPGSRERLPGIARLFRTLAPEAVAAAIVRAVEAERRTVCVPVEFRLAVTLQRLLPGIFRWLVAKTGWKRPPPDADGR